MFSSISEKSHCANPGDDLVVKLAVPGLSTVSGAVKTSDDIMLIRMDESKFIAVSTICRHKGCDVELEGDKFVAVPWVGIYWKVKLHRACKS
jgi:Rieske Fe-S protein